MHQLPEVTGQFRDGDVRATFCDISRTATEFGYAPQMDVEAGSHGANDVGREPTIALRMYVARQAGPQPAKWLSGVQVVRQQPSTSSTAKNPASAEQTVNLISPTAIDDLVNQHQAEEAVGSVAAPRASS